MIGKILGNRYQVVEKIGDGGTAFVYKGMDNLLNRHVTIKVLRPEYVSDQDFVRRFRREAQAAASLSHPNIVSIYDVGFEDGIHYIVMEYIQGQSLKELIDDMGHLPVKMAADYACQIAHALGKAHKHGIIHRDVKPHNILIGEDGRVKVTDFGIAQAVTASTVTYNGAILGSVHYFSPEQARGGQTEEKSDLYSLGVVLFEMLTGRVPFSGDSPVSIAVKHLQEPFPNPREINPEIPEAVSRIIKKAVEKDPENRYRSAREMSDDLSSWLLGRDVKSTVDPAPIITKARTENPPVKSRTKKGMKPWQWIAVITGILLLFFIIFGFIRLRDFLIVPDVVVPEVEGETLARAAELLDEAGLHYRIADQIASDTVPAGHVIGQTPAAGRKVKRMREIELVLSTGPDLVAVEDVVGKMVREARLILERAGFKVEVIERHSEEPPNTVIQQDPGPGHRISKGSTVTLVVSIGGRPFRIANLEGLTLDDARNWLELFGLKLRRVSEEPSNIYAAGVVLNQFPAAGELVQAGDEVDLVISKGPEHPSLPRHTIEISIADIPIGETFTVTVRDTVGERTDPFESDGTSITVFGYGQGTVTLRWGDRVETRTFP